MATKPWDRNEKPCQSCKAIHDDEKGRLKQRMVPCLEVHKLAAISSTPVLLAFDIDDIGWPCPFAQSVSDLMPYALNRTVQADETSSKVLDLMAKDMRETRFPNDLVNPRPLPDLGLYDDQPVLRSPGSTWRAGRTVILRGEKNDPLWQQFKPWYLNAVSASLDGWNLFDRVGRVWEGAAMGVSEELQAIIRSLATRGNAAKIVALMGFILLAGLAAAGRVLLAATGAILTAVQVADLAAKFWAACRETWEADTEAGLNRASATLASFWAALVAAVGITLAAAAMARLLGYTLKRAAVKSESDLSKLEEELHATSEELEAAQQKSLNEMAKNGTLGTPTSQSANQGRVIKDSRVVDWKNGLKAPVFAAKRASKVQGAAFCDFPAMKDWPPGRISNWLNDNGFFLVKEGSVKTVNGVQKTESSAIWFRLRPQITKTGKIEAVRIDAQGHAGNPSHAGSTPHFHKDLLDWDRWKEYLHMQVKVLPVPHGENGRVVSTSDPNYFPESHIPAGRNTPRSR